MSKIRRLLVVAALLLTAACSHAPAPTAPGGNSGGGGGAIPTSFTADSAYAAHATVDGTGGTITATGADGARYVLTVPAGALAIPTDLTVTPLEDVRVDGHTAAWQVGVELGPSGTQFLDAVTLHVVPPASAPTASAITQVDGSGTVFVPVASPAAAASFDASLWHFSDYLVTSVTDDRLTRAADAAIAAVHDPATAEDIQKLAHLLVAAKAALLTDVATRLQQALTAAIASFDQWQQNNASPTAGTVLGGLIAYQVVGSTGLSNEVGTLQNGAQSAFATWMRVLDLAYLKATGFADLQALVPPFGQAIAMTHAYPFLLQSGGVLDPSGDAQKIIDEQLVIADADCNNARFTTGLMELQDLIGGVHLLGVTSPSAQQLQDDASTCVAPQVTGIELPADFVGAHATTTYSSKAGTVVDDLEPPSAQVAGAASAQASASTVDASSDASLVATATGNSVTFSASGSADATVNGTSDAGCSYANLGTSTTQLLRIDYDHARGPILLTVDYTGGAGSTSGTANATIRGVVGGSNLWASGPGKGSLTVHLGGLGWVPGQPDPSSSVSVDLELNVGAGVCAGFWKAGSASMGATVTVQVQPDPQQP
jgi:hypothetical protein